MLVREFLKGAWGKLLARSFPHIKIRPIKTYMHLNVFAKCERQRSRG